MGRKRVELTPEQIEERRRKYWGEERNSLRRSRYHSDPAYRETVVQQVRDSYRKQREEQGLPYRDEDCRENLALLPEMATVREVFFPDRAQPEKHMTLTAEELAEALNRNTQVLYRWLNAEMFPRPVFMAVTHRGRKQGVYLKEEAEALINAFGEHQEVSQYYRAYNTETRARLFGAVAKIRQMKGVVDGRGENAQ